MNWVEEVADGWPSPIAHEYHRLRELVEGMNASPDTAPGGGFQGGIEPFDAV